MSASQDCRNRAREHHRRHHRHPQGDKERERPELGRNAHVHPVHLLDRDDPGCGLLVLTLQGDRISAITWFFERSFFPHFGLPRTLPE
jgi:hypothetical protein